MSMLSAWLQTIRFNLAFSFFMQTKMAAGFLALWAKIAVTGSIREG